MSSLPNHDQLVSRAAQLLAACGATTTDGDQTARTPITGGSLGSGRTVRERRATPSNGRP